MKTQRTTLSLLLGFLAGGLLAASVAGAAPAGNGDHDDGDAWLPGQPDPQNRPGGPRGAELYETVCKTCHLGGVARAPTPFILSLMPPAAIVRALTTGAMRAQGEALSEADRKAVAEHITGKVLEESTKLVPPACEGEAARFDVNQPPAFPAWGIRHDNARHIDSRTAGIDATNLGRLKLQWAVGFDGGTKVRSQPALAGGAVYLGSDDSHVYALDRKTGCLRWRFAASAEVRTGIVVSPWQAGDMSARPLLFFGDVNGSTYAVDAISGALAWKDRADPHPTTVLTAAPVLYRDKLYVPVSSLEEGTADGSYDCCTFRGSVVAYEAATGRRLWQSFLTGEPKLLGKYKNGRLHYGPSGVALWNTPSIDAGRGVMYFGTGDDYTTPSTGMSDAIVAMELETGKIRWVNQVTPGDAWNTSCAMPGAPTCHVPDAPDYDFGAAVILAKTSAGRDLVVSGQKSGWVYAMDPADGKLVWKTRVGRGGIMAGVYFGMSVVGDRLFVPISDPPDGKEYDIPPQYGIFALDLKTGEFLWRAPNGDENCKGRGPACSPGIAAASTATDDLILTGASDGWVRIYEGATGKVLWQFDTLADFVTVTGATARGGSIGGGAGPIAHDGWLFIESGYGFAGRMPGNVMLAFKVE